jgi:hypothetical protein
MPSTPSPVSMGPRWTSSGGCSPGRRSQGDDRRGGQAGCLVLLQLDLVRSPGYVPIMSTKPRAPRPSPTGDVAGGTAPTSGCPRPPRPPTDKASACEDRSEAFVVSGYGPTVA